MAKLDNTPADNNKSALKATDLAGSTIDTSAGSTQRKHNEQKMKGYKPHRTDPLCQTMIFHALSAIHKALLEAAKIPLGRRCYFHLEVSDWKGWPRMDLKLVDRRAAVETPHSLTVLGHVRGQTGIVQFKLDAGQTLGYLEFNDGSQFEKLPAILKSAMRRFLTVVSEYVLNSADSNKVLETEAKQHAFERKEALPLSQSLSTLDLFTEEEDKNDNIVPNADVQPLDPL